MRLLRSLILLCCFSFFLLSAWENVRLWSFVAFNYAWFLFSLCRCGETLWCFQESYPSIIGKHAFVFCFFCLLTVYLFGLHDNTLLESWAQVEGLFIGRGRRRNERFTLNASVCRRPTKNTLTEEMRMSGCSNAKMSFFLFLWFHTDFITGMQLCANSLWYRYFTLI